MPRKNRWLIYIGYLMTLLWVGCGEEVEYANDVLVEESNSPYVQSKRSGSKEGITVKYLPPRFLAIAETGGSSGADLDSLTNLFAQSIYFSVVVKRAGIDAEAGAAPPAIPAALLSEDLKNCFWIETRDTVYTSDIAQMEHHDGRQCRYMVAFAVDPRQSLTNDDTVTLAFANLQGSSGITRFDFSASEILRSSDVTQRTR